MRTSTSDASEAPQTGGAYRPRPTIGQIIVGRDSGDRVRGDCRWRSFWRRVSARSIGGQKVGLVPTRAPGGSGPLIALLPTAGPAPPAAIAQTLCPTRRRRRRFHRLPRPTRAARVPTIGGTASRCRVITSISRQQAINDARDRIADFGAAGTDADQRNFVDELSTQWEAARRLPERCDRRRCLSGFDATIEAARAIGAKETATRWRRSRTTRRRRSMIWRRLAQVRRRVTLAAQPTPAA